MDVTLLEVDVFFQALSNARPDKGIMAKIAKLVNVNGQSAHKWRRRNNQSNSNNSNNSHNSNNSQIQVVERKPIQSVAGPRKELLSMMNKLTTTNVDSILKRVSLINVSESHFREYVDVVWDLMQRQPDYQPLYIRVLRSLGTKEQTAVTVCALYDEWNALRDEGTIECPTSSSEEYDEFCEYMKWKKRKIASATAWLRMIVDGLLCTSTLLEYISTFLLRPPTECAVEQLIAMSQLLSPMQRRSLGPQLKEPMEKWATAQLSDRYRFKLMDLQEMYFAPFRPSEHLLGLRPKSCTKIVESTF